jgi:hypothetical protein
MPAIRSGQVVAFYLFDVADSIDLSKVASGVGAAATAARLAPKPVTPPYVQYDKPPISFDGAAVGIPELDGFQVRFRAYDYGVISIALTRSLACGWSDLIGVGQSLFENQDLEQRAEAICRRIVDRLGAARPRNVEGERQGKARDARRHLSFRRGAVVDFARSVSRAHRRADSDPRAAAGVHRRDEVGVTAPYMQCEVADRPRDGGQRDVYQGRNVEFT